MRNKNDRTGINNQAAMERCYKYCVKNVVG